MTMTKRKDFQILCQGLDSLHSQQIEGARYHADQIGCHEAAKDVRA